MTRYYLVRHAQTLWNSENRLQGHSDLPLSALGETQARQVGQWFAARRVQGIFTSPLQRSRQTAHAIASGLSAAPTNAQGSNGQSLSLIVERDLAEMHLRAWEGLTPEEIDTRFDGAYRQWKQRSSSVLIPQAEAVEDFRARVRGVWQRLIEGAPEGEHVIVSHGGVIAALLADLLEAEYDLVLRGVRVDNASVTAIELNGGAPHVLWVNATEHLAA